jgi:hypothetical protein
MEMDRVSIFCVLALSGFLPAGCSARGGAVKIVNHRPGLSFVRFVDPRENAFSTEVPKGWRSSGGLFRFAPVDTRGAVESISPEGDVRVSWGDADLPPFAIPSPMLFATGFREGSWYSPGYGVRMLVRRYQAGAAFAEEYVRAIVARRIGCADLTVTNRGSRPDLTDAINSIYARLGGTGVRARQDAGELAFECVRDGRPWRGYYLAVTMQTSSPMGGIWNVDRVLGFTAAADRAGVAHAALLRLAGSMQLNPEWVRMQQGVTLSTSRIVAQTNEQISSTIRTTFGNKWKAEDRIFRHDANARRGVTDLADPNSGETWTVESSSRYYWHKPGSDVIVGTETYDSPGVGYEPLREY